MAISKARTTSTGDIYFIARDVRDDFAASVMLTRDELLALLAMSDSELLVVRRVVSVGIASALTVPAVPAEPTAALPNVPRGTSDLRPADKLTNVEAAAAKLGNLPASQPVASAADLSEFTFHNVEICIPAASPELAYTALCNALASIDADWVTDTYTLPSWMGSNRDRIDVSTLYPKG